MRRVARDIRLALDTARRLRPPRSGRRSLVLGAVLLVASTITVLATSNTPPTITSATVTPAVLNEGQASTLSVTFTDPDVADFHTVRIHWSDKTPSTEIIQLLPGQTSFQTTHTFLDSVFGPSGSKIEVAVYDRSTPPGTEPNGNAEGSGHQTLFVPIDVQNVAPSLSNVSVSRASTPFQSLTSFPIVVAGNIVDPGAADTEQVSALWGDEPAFPPPTPTPCSVTGRTFRCTHSYRLQSNARTYTIHLRVVDDDGGQGSAIASVQVPAAPSASLTGTSDLGPKNARIAPGDPLTYEVSWTVPPDRVWRVLATIDLRLRKGQDTALWIRWDEASNGLCLVENDVCGPTGTIGAAQVLEGPIASLNLGASSTQGSGPTGQRVTLRLALTFKPQAPADTYVADLGATDDEGRHDDFKHAGTLGIERQHGTP